MCGAVGVMFLYLNAVIFTARMPVGYRQSRVRKESKRQHVFSRQKPVDGTCIQGAGPNE